MLRGKIRRGFAMESGTVDLQAHLEDQESHWGEDGWESQVSSRVAILQEIRGECVR